VFDVNVGWSYVDGSSVAPVGCRSITGLVTESFSASKPHGWAPM